MLEYLLTSKVELAEYEALEQIKKQKVENLQWRANSNKRHEKLKYA